MKVGSGRGGGGGRLLRAAPAVFNSHRGAEVAWVEDATRADVPDARRTRISYSPDFVFCPVRVSSC